MKSLKRLGKYKVDIEGYEAKALRGLFSFQRAKGNNDGSSITRAFARVLLAFLNL